MNAKYHELLNKLTPFIIARKNIVANTQKGVLGCKEIKVIDPLDNQNLEFFEQILTLDQLAFGGEAMAMPRWVLFDCALYPGAIIGFGIDSEQLSLEDQKVLKTKGKRFVPLSMYITIPNAHDDSWFGHNLSSLNGRLKEDLNGLGLLTKYFALQTLNIKKLVGATQWSSVAVYLHLKLSPLKILSPHLAMHTMTDSFCYESSSFYSAEKVFSDLAMKPQKTIELNLTELDKLEEMLKTHQVYVIEKNKKSLKLSLERI